MSEATLLPGFRPHFAEIDGVRTRYFLGGEGPPLTIVHGLGGAAVNFTKLAPILARRRRVLIPDLPGHGLSEPLEHAEGIATYSRHVHKVAELEGMLPGAVARLLHGRRRRASARRRAARRRDRRSRWSRRRASSRPRAARRSGLPSPAAIRPAQVMTRFRGTFARRPRLRWLPFGLWGAVDPPSRSQPDARPRLPRRPLAAHRRRQRGPRPPRRRPPSRPRPRPLPGLARLGRARPARARSGTASSTRGGSGRRSASCPRPGTSWSASSPSRARRSSKAS